MPVNDDAWAIWQECRTQWHVTSMGKTGLIYAEARQAANDLGIEYTIRNRRKIQALEHFDLKRQHESRQSNDHDDAGGQDGQAVS